MRFPLLRRRRRSLEDQTGPKDNVFAVLMHHADDCHLVRHPFEADLSLCTCAAIHDPSQQHIQGTHNLVTDDGDVFWADEFVAGYKGTGPLTTYDRFAFADEQPTEGKASNTGSFGTPPSATFEAMFDGSTPLTNFSDSGNNPGSVAADVVTFRCTLTTGQANFTIQGVGLIDGDNTFGSGTDPLHAIAVVSPGITKTSNDTLTGYWNMTVEGA